MTRIICMPELHVLVILLVLLLSNDPRWSSPAAADAFQHGPPPSSRRSSSPLLPHIVKSRGVRATLTLNDVVFDGRRSRHFYALTTLFARSSEEEQDLDDGGSTTSSSKVSKRRRVLNLLGLRRRRSDSSGSDGPSLFHVTTQSELDDYFDDVSGRFRKKKKKKKTEKGEGGDDYEIDYDALLSSLSVKGDTQKYIGSSVHKDVIHPVVRLLHERKRKIQDIKKREKSADDNTDDGGQQQQQQASSSSQPEFRNKRNIRRVLPPDDGCRVALAVEGGGMRGCVTAGMVTAIHTLGLEDTIDVVYGSSAGTVIGAYFITRQLPWFGPELYYDALTTAGPSFVNTKRFLRALGLGLLDPRLTKDVIFRRNHGKPVLDLTYLLNTTMQENKPLDWETFEEMQRVQPLKVMASGLKSQRAFILDMERGSFSSIEELSCCMRASCLLPGVAGPVMNMRVPRGEGEEKEQPRKYEMTPRNKFDGGGDDDYYEPLADSLLFEPMPYRAAISEGATHVICLRSRPDGVDVTGKSSMLEKLILRRFLLRKNRLRNIYDYMRRQFHKRLYASQVIELNDAAHDIDRPYTDTTAKPHLLPIAVPPGSAEVTRLETGREAIFEGVRRGFARAYDALVEDPEERGRGMEVAREVFPDDIMNYDPLIYTSKNESAYDAYLRDLDDGAR